MGEAELVVTGNGGDDGDGEDGGNATKVVDKVVDDVVDE